MIYCIVQRSNISFLKAGFTIYTQRLIECFIEYDKFKKVERNIWNTCQIWHVEQISTAREKIEIINDFIENKKKLFITF